MRYNNNYYCVMSHGMDVLFHYSRFTMFYETHNVFLLYSMPFENTQKFSNTK